MTSNGKVRAGAVMNQRGFTLSELLVVCALAGFIMAGLLSLFLSGQQGYLRGVSTVEATQSARVAIARMAQEIRGAGYTPSGVAFSAIINQTATSFTLQNDWNGNGVIEPGITVADPVTGMVRGEQVTYSLSGSDLRRQESTVDAAPLVVATGVNQIAFQYQDANNALTAISADIRSIVVNVTATPQYQMAAALGGATVGMQDRIRLRNR